MVEKWVESYRQDSTHYWGMYLENGEMIASIGVTVTSEQDLNGELGYKLGSRWWNRGYATEAAKAVIDHMFRNTDIKRHDAVYSVNNPASGRVMEKVGMNCEGLLRHFYKTRDGFHDCYIYALLREDWEKL